MGSKDSFVKWLENNSKLAPYSINRYANAIETIASELGEYGLAKQNLYHISDVNVIDAILLNPLFQEKNIRGNNMYSAALNHFKKYISET